MTFMSMTQAGANWSTNRTSSWEMVPSWWGSSARLRWLGWRGEETMEWVGDLVDDFGAGRGRLEKAAGGYQKRMRRGKNHWRSHCELID